MNTFSQWSIEEFDSPAYSRGQWTGDHVDMKFNLGSTTGSTSQLCKCNFKQMESVNTADSNAVPTNNVTHTTIHSWAHVQYAETLEKLHIQAMHKENSSNNISVFEGPWNLNVLIDKMRLCLVYMRLESSIHKNIYIQIILETFIIS